jgi:3,5-epimerase/4-reductase
MSDAKAPEPTPTDKKDMLILIFGKNGWIGGQMGAICEAQGIAHKYATTRLQNTEAVTKELQEIKPTHVINAAGVTGRPNVDWCESHRPETIRSNVIGTLNLIDLCYQNKIHVTNLATGCIFKYDEEHPLGSGKGFTEEDSPNFFESFYSLTKGMVEIISKNYPNCCTLRVRMPISDDLKPRNFITKIAKYDHVVDIPNSMTILYDLLPTVPKFAQRNLTGVYNFTNPGVISHNEILDLYKKYIDNDYTYKNFTEEQQAKILKAGRSNNELDTTKLSAAFPEVPHIKKGIIGVFERMKAQFDKDGFQPPKRAKKA